MIKIPKKLSKYLYLYQNRELDLLSGYLSFTTLLSLIPFLALIVALAKWIGHRDQATLETVIRLVEVLIPEAAAKVRENVLLLLQSVRIKRLGLGAILPLAVILLFKLRMIRESFQSVLGAEKDPSWMKEIVSFLVVVGISPLAFSYFDHFFDFTHSGPHWMILARISKFLIWVIFILVLIYVFVPLKVSWLRKIYFSLLGGAFLYLTNAAFSTVVIRVVQVNKLYGAFAAVPLFLIWVYIFWRTVTLCVVFTCEPFLEVTKEGRVKSSKSSKR